MTGTDELAGILEELAGQIATAEWGHADDAARLARRLEWLVDILVRRGTLQPGHRKLLDKLKPLARVVRLHVVSDKYQVQGPDIDCASLLHLCNARCCSMTVPLSPQDLDERLLEWKVDEPYVLPRVADGYCVHLGEGARCDAYQHRPATCREYDCRNDRRVWLDWERKIPADLPITTFPRAYAPPAPAASPDE